MRIGLVAQWLRAGIEDPARRRTAFRYAIGIGVLQVGWFAAPLPGRARRTVGHRSGRPVRRPGRPRAGRAAAGPSGRGRPTGTRTTSPSGTACSRSSCSARASSPSSNAVRRAVEVTVGSADLIAGRGLRPGAAVRPLVAVLPAPGRSTAGGPADRSYRWGYGHYGIFAALAALGAGLEVAVEQTGHHLHLSPTAVELRRRDPGRGVPAHAVAGPRADHRRRPSPQPAVILASVALVLAIATRASAGRRGRGSDVCRRTARRLGAGSRESAGRVVAGGDQSTLVGEHDGLDAIPEAELARGHGRRGS